MRKLCLMLLFSALSLSGCSENSTVANTEEKYAIGDLGGVSVDLPRACHQLSQTTQETR